MKHKFVKESLDSDKILYELLDPIFLESVANILTIGAKKYPYGKDPLYNWKNADLEDLHHYEGAIFRHFQEYRKGNVLDDETSEPHLAHIVCSCMFLEYFRRVYGWTTKETEKTFT